MTAIARKVQIGTAACAIAAAAALTPAAPAQADAINSGPGTIVFFENSGSFDNVNFFFVIGQLGPYSTISA
jgi:hypothetical protein